MGMQHECKKGTVIQVGEVRIEVLRGSPRLAVIAPPKVAVIVLTAPPSADRRGASKPSLDTPSEIAVR